MEPLFKSWSFLHILTIVFPLLLSILVIFLTRKVTKKQSYTIGYILSIVGISTLLARNIEIFIVSGYQWPNWDLIPLQLCHVANFVLLAAYISKKEILFGIAYTIFMPGALMALVFSMIPNLPELFNLWYSARTIAYIFGHAILVMLPIYSLYHKHLTITIKKILQITLLVAGIYIVELVISNLLNISFMGMTVDDSIKANYFHTIHTNNTFPLTLFYQMGIDLNLNHVYGGWFKVNYIYILMCFLLGVVVIFAFSGIYYLGSFINKKIYQIKELKDIPKE